ncbi:SDR family NAD(P)-dependent oxidoreductase [Atopococcus tabaci]|uniref:SDR family NAD(P)-dependent oxidoreductase n=1 Tax=Atopococcus tabaci TaxID=269774 RepID=UPI0003FEEEA5|nr:SDR family oxidoreductase [Atopococcus tabaci]
MFQLKDKVTVVTGAASGIGLATAVAFAEKGAKVVLSDYDSEKGEARTNELKEKGHDVLFIKTDVSKEQEVKELIEKTVDQFGRIDVIVNNAGVGAQGDMHETSDEEYKRVISINQDGVFYGSKYAVQQMLKTGGGVIINMSSILSLVGEPTAFAYNASKGAVRLMTQSMALRYAKDNIRVTAIAPGYVETGMVNKEALGEYYDGLVAKHPIGRLGQPEEIAHAVVFAVENEFVTGITIPVEGGYTAQ